MKLNKLIAFLSAYETIYPDENIEEREVYFFNRDGKCYDEVDLTGDENGEFLMLEAVADYGDGNPPNLKLVK